MAAAVLSGLELRPAKSDGADGDTTRQSWAVSAGITHHTADNRHSPISHAVKLGDA